MPRISENTRGFIRFKSGIGTNIQVSPPFSDLVVTARLIDVNKAGGVGFFIPLAGVMDNMPLLTIFAPWKIIRESKEKSIAMSAQFLNVIPMLMHKEYGIRISGIMIQAEGRSEPAAPPSTQRRKAKRKAMESIPAIFTRRNDRMDGELFNASNADGIGVLVGKEGVRNVAWKSVFLPGWKLIIGDKPLSCHIHRLGLFGKKLIVGGSAPGLSEIVRVKDPEKRKSTVATATEDKELIKFLGAFMEGKYDPGKKR